MAEKPEYDQSSRAGMTYDWNGHTHEIDRPELSDYAVAGEVRMLMRSQLNHEEICVMARSRIMGLSKELKRVKADNAAMLAALKDVEASLQGRVHSNPALKALSNAADVIAKAEGRTNG